MQDKTDAYFGIASGVLGVLGATAEITAGAMSKMAGRFAATRVTQVAFAGGLLAGLSAIAEAVQSAVKAGQRFEADDADAGGWYARSSIALALSGVAGIAGSLAMASTAGALTGVFSVLTGVGAAAATVPVWGWIAASVLLLAGGLIMLWQAIKDTDTPLEVWLLGSVYGKGQKRLAPSEELDGINDLMYAMKIEVEWRGDEWELKNNNFYDDYDDFVFRIGLPGAGSESVIDCKVTLIGRQGRKEIFHETIRPKVVNRRIADPHVAMIGPAPTANNPSTPRYLWWQPPSIDSDGRSYVGHLKVDDDLYFQAEVEFQYWPDQRSMPNFVLPKAIDQRTLIGTK